MWIDAIRNKQNDNIERGHQVQQMGSIYASAIDVLVWLGELPELDRTFKLLNKDNTYSLGTNGMMWQKTKIL